MLVFGEPSPFIHVFHLAVQNLLMEKQKCKSKRDALQTRVGQLHQKLERMKLDLQDSEVFKKLDALDQKARVLGQNIYTVADCTLPYLSSVLAFFFSR